MSFPTIDYFAASPLLCMVVLSLAVLTVEFLVEESEKISFYITVVGIGICIFLTVIYFPVRLVAFHGMLRLDPFGNFFNGIFLLSALLVTFLSESYLQKENINFGEFYILILLATIGMMLIASAADLIIIFLGIELMSLCLYVLAGFKRKNLKSNESALKYFLLGAFATGFLLYGIALVYGASGTTNIVKITNDITNLSTSYLFWAGTGLIVVGFAFKVAVVPFHMWVPDVYEGSPTPATAFMSTASKAAAFAAFIVVFGRVVQGYHKLATVLAILSAASMILGNIIAISQSNLKRMLAYSSIAHAGYMLAGLAAGNALGLQGIMFYLGVYSMMNIGAFGVLSLMEQDGEKNLSYDEYSGFSERYPFAAALMAVFMFSLAGIPPFGGFFAKYYVFTAAISADLTWLAIVGVLTSLISVYYYLRLVVVMYFGSSTTTFSNRLPRLGFTAIVISAVGIIGFGLFPSLILSLTDKLF